MRFDLTVNEFARDVALSRELVVFGEQFWRPYIHVRDAARAVLLVLESPSAALNGNVFNVGDTAENYRKIDIVELLKERVPNANIRLVHKDEDPRDYRVSFEKVKTCLAFQVKSSLPDGIDEVMALVGSGLIADPFAPEYKN
jgi:nucleoside-diphosphate-sugar epimerase